MAALDFPDAPVVGDAYGSAGVVWRWDGLRWASTAGAAGQRGAVAYAQVVANQTGITATAIDLAGLTVTFNAIAGRRYRATGWVLVSATAANNTACMRLTDAANTQVQMAQTAIPVVANAPSLPLSHTWVAATTGLVTYKLRLEMPNGSGSISMLANPIYPAFLLVEDITYEAGTGPTLDTLPKGLISYLAGTNVVVSSLTPTWTVLQTGSVPLVAGRNYCLSTDSTSSYITGGVSGTTFALNTFIDNVNVGGRLIVDTVLSGGYIPQPHFDFRFKATATKTSVVEMRSYRQTASTGTMTARFDLSVIDEGAFS